MGDGYFRRMVLAEAAESGPSSTLQRLERLRLLGTASATPRRILGSIIRIGHIVFDGGSPG